MHQSNLAYAVSGVVIALAGWSAVSYPANVQSPRDSLSAHGLATLATQGSSLPPVRRLLIKVKEQPDATGALAPYSQRITAHQAHLTRIEQTFQLKLRKPVFSRLHSTLQNRFQRGSVRRAELGDRV